MNSEEYIVKFPKGRSLIAYSLEEARIMRDMFPFGRILDKGGHWIDRPLCQDYLKALKKAWVNEVK